MGDFFKPCPSRAKAGYKIEDEDTNEIYFTDVACRYLDEFQISTIKFILHNSLTQCSIFRAVRKLTS
jgi:uncharacterized cysteine cluster protein YcgN (CxxCxxCC family)